MKMKKEQCNKILQFICINLDENIHSKRCAEIKKHIEECTDCSAYLHTLKQTIAFYRSYPVPPLSKKEKEKIFKKAKSIR
ncbi:MAG: hypothetical protein AAB071_01350 [Bacteroidota bacterium]